RGWCHAAITLFQSTANVFGPAILPQVRAAFFEKLPPCLVGIESCASSHHWSRELKAFGHTVKPNQEFDGFRFLFPNGDAQSRIEIPALLRHWIGARPTFDLSPSLRRFCERP